MSYYNQDWLYNEYKKLFINITGSEPNRYEKDFLKDFFHPYHESRGKEIYYMSIYRFKRGWSKYFIYLFAKIALKKEFQKDEKLESLVKVHKIFANKMINDAIKAYCKIND